jgi:hypothetical protein
MIARIIDALSVVPEGIQITVYPGRAVVDLGYCKHERFESVSLEYTLYKVWAYLHDDPTCPREVRSALEAMELHYNTFIGLYL